MSQQLVDYITELGLSDNEAKVYVALTKLGATSTGPLIKESGLYRVILYDTLEQLVSRGLVTYALRRNRKLFQAEPPERLLALAEEKRRCAELAVQKLSSLLTERPLDHGALVFEGWAGIRAAQRHHLDRMRSVKEGEYLMVGASRQLHGKLDEFYNSFHQERARIGISAKLLFNENNREYGLLKMSFKPVEVRILGATTSMPSWFSTFDDLVLLGVTEDQPLAFLIRNAAVAESHRQCFASLWKGGTAL